MARGNNGQTLFEERSQYQFYLDLVLSMKPDHPFEVYHYCLMSNHVHFLMKFGDSLGLSRVMHRVNLTYAKRFCKTKRFHGHVFQDRFKTIPVQDDAYLLECGRYIERNPVKAGLTQDPLDYPWSSFEAYVSGRENRLVTPNPLFLGLSNNAKARAQLYADYVRTERPYDRLVERDFFAKWRGQRLGHGTRTLL